MKMHGISKCAFILRAVRERIRHVVRDSKSRVSTPHPWRPREEAIGSISIDSKPGRVTVAGKMSSDLPLGLLKSI